MSEPDNPRWLDDVGDELRQEVPVRASWRARLLDDVARARRPVSGDDFDDRDDDGIVLSANGVAPTIATRSRHRRIVLRPLAGLAAALVFVALGAGATLTALSWHAHGAGETPTAGATP